MPGQSSKAQTGLGAVLSIGGISGAGGSETFIPVAQLRKIPFKMPKWKTTDTTNFQSSVETVGKTIPGVTELTLEGDRLVSDAGQAAIVTAYASPEAYDFKIQLLMNPAIPQTVAGDLITFTAKVTDLDMNLDVAAEIPFKCSMTYDSLPIITPGS